MGFVISWNYYLCKKRKFANVKNLNIEIKIWCNNKRSECFKGILLFFKRFIKAICHSKVNRPATDRSDWWIGLIRNELMKFSRKFHKIFENMFEGEKVDIISKIVSITNQIELRDRTLLIYSTRNINFYFFSAILC